MSKKIVTRVRFQYTLANLLLSVMWCGRNCVVQLDTDYELLATADVSEPRVWVAWLIG
jgi:hypothetical protein